MKCLTCRDVQLVVADSQGIEIDYCPECRGIWLDRGELDEIIKRALAMPFQQRYEERKSKINSNDYKCRKEEKKQSFIDELLDFSF